MNRRYVTIGGLAASFVVVALVAGSAFTDTHPDPFGVQCGPDVGNGFVETAHYHVTGDGGVDDVIDAVVGGSDTYRNVKPDPDSLRVRSIDDRTTLVEQSHKDVVATYTAIRLSNRKWKIIEVTVCSTDGL